MSVSQACYLAGLCVEVSDPISLPVAFRQRRAGIVERCLSACTGAAGNGLDASACRVGAAVRNRQNQLRPSSPLRPVATGDAPKMRAPKGWFLQTGQLHLVFFPIGFPAGRGAWPGALARNGRPAPSACGLPSCPFPLRVRGFADAPGALSRGESQTKERDHVRLHHIDVLVSPSTAASPSGLPKSARLFPSRSKPPRSSAACSGARASPRSCIATAFAAPTRPSSNLRDLLRYNVLGSRPPLGEA
jgi:hypothetical protein